MLPRGKRLDGLETLPAIPNGPGLPHARLPERRLRPIKAGALSLPVAAKIGAAGPSRVATTAAVATATVFTATAVATTAVATATVSASVRAVSSPASTRRPAILKALLVA